MNLFIVDDRFWFIPSEEIARWRIIGPGKEVGVVTPSRRGW
jgi:hypothetical protein